MYNLKKKTETSSLSTSLCFYFIGCPTLGIVKQVTVGRSYMTVRGM
jgi:hypothetical protein